VPDSTALLPRDGNGFFSDRITSIGVRSPDDPGTAERVAERLVDHYFGRRVDVLVEPPGRTTRAVVIDRDVAVPGQPIVYSVGDVPTLYLHAATAEQDLARLVDQPTFGSLAAGTSGCDEPDVARADAEPQGQGAAAEVLAFIDDRPDSSGADPASSALSPPLADSAPSGDQWPLGLAGGSIALAATAGLLVRHRDRRRRESSESTTATPAEALLEASRPVLPVADLPPVKPRVIFLDEADAPSPTPPDNIAPNREIDLHPRRPESPLARLVEKVAAGTDGPLLTRHEFARQVNTEWSRHQHGGNDGAVASLVLSELDSVRLRLGNNAADRLFTEVAEQLDELSRPLDVIGLAGENEIAILMPDVDEDQARSLLDDFAKKIAATTFTAIGERVLLTPATGFAMLSDTATAPDLIRAVESARALSMLNLHLDPERWDSTAVPLHSSEAGPSTWATIKKKLRTPVQILATFVLAWGVPFGIYVALAAIGLDITFPMYLFLVSSLVLTGAFILAEGAMAMKQKEPPEVPTKPYPKASALIAAYLPNEAATVIETIEAFLAIEYPNELQIILAYNTPDPMPVEEHLDRIAEKHPNFVPVRIVGSNSKAQNVNAALSMADGAFIGMFDADHQPRPDAFTRAWRWIDAGYDVVQGHCLTRNGDAGWLAKMIAVEFESIYAVAHPGRAKMHRFGVFGGSNGFWRTELLHETRMRGSMLTEDIDSSMRVVERGFKIRSDRDLVSRELATTTFKQVWNQRMRWAQGWFQVSMAHMKLAYRSKELNVRQKLGIFHLLMWREIYPWLSQQLFPLLAFWALRAGGLGELDWTIPIFVATSIFTFSVGPLQTVFAYKLADPEIKQHKKWFWGYLLFTTPFYTEYKNLISRVAHIKQFMGESDWRVTPRSADPA